MNERTLGDRLHATGPLILRLAIATVLVVSGLQQTVGVPGLPETLQTGTSETPMEEFFASMSPDGIHITANWASLVGFGEVASGGLLALGLLTRPLVLLLMGAIGFGLSRGAVPGFDPTALCLLAGACLSLLVSGPGCFALRRPRQRVYVQQPPMAAHPEPEPRRRPRRNGFVRPRKLPHQYIAEWFKNSKQRWGRRRSWQPRRRWRFWQFGAN